MRIKRLRKRYRIAKEMMHPEELKKIENQIMKLFYIYEGVLYEKI